MWPEQPRMPSYAVAATASPPSGAGLETDAVPAGRAQASGLSQAVLGQGVGNMGRSVSSSAVPRNAFRSLTVP